MDVREQLVELLRVSPHLDVIKGYKGNDCTFEQGADWLITHGVTVQKWIPVTERLPKPFESVLALIPSEAPLPTVHESYIADHDEWVCILTVERYKPGEVTHWMPMPEASKEV